MERNHHWEDKRVCSNESNGGTSSPPIKDYDWSIPWFVNNPDKPGEYYGSLWERIRNHEWRLRGLIVVNVIMMYLLFIIFFSFRGCEADCAIAINQFIDSGTFPAKFYDMKPVWPLLLTIVPSLLMPLCLGIFSGAGCRYNKESVALLRRSNVIIARWINYTTFVLLLLSMCFVIFVDISISGEL